MNLGLISTFAVKCGIATYSTYLGEALQALGIKVTGLSEYPFPDEKAIDKDFQPSFPFINCWRRNESSKELIQKSQEFDAIHVQHELSFFPDGIMQYTYERLKQPIITTLHTTVEPSVAYPQFGDYFNTIIHGSEKIIVHTPTCYRFLKLWHCPEEKMHLIPHGTKLIDVPTKEQARETLNLPKDAKIVLSWGFIWERKGLSDLVNIFIELKKTYPNSVLIHAGGIHPVIPGAPYLRSVLTKAIKGGLTPKDYIVTGWLPENAVTNYFGATDVIVLNYSNRNAAASGAAHRAMASGRPIVKTDNQCIEEIPGLEVQRGDINALYQAILKMLGDETLQKEWGEKAMKSAIETSWQNVALQHQKVYL